MVMETPSPICVGREFVRQYYTMLHEAPEHLHRFYSHNSSFVHGGVEKPGEEQPPVMGQSEIHKKIMTLNFNDCHAKIRQVDSQATVDQAVVVQVTGELSNSGQPMRRFMQTFVLAPQSPKKYYVHNDIFRYQDEVFHDSDNETDTMEEAGDSEAEIVDEAPVPQEPVPEPQVSYYKQEPQPLSNGNMVEEQPDSPPVKADPEEEEEEPEEEIIEEPEPVKEPVYEEKEPEKVPEPEPQPEVQQAPAEVSKPFSWAALAASKSPASAPTTTQPPPQPAAKPQPVVKPAEVKPTENVGAPQPQRTQRPRPERISREREPMMTRGGGPMDMDDPRRARFPDNQQLFVGNLPHNIQERDLKSFFEKHGKVIDVRINRKGASSNVPNFGFVIFEETETVQSILDMKPIFWGETHRLNVEEKKQRGDQGGRPGSGTRLGGRGASNMGRGGRGGMGGMGMPPSRMDTRGGRGGGGFGGPPRR